MMLHEIQKSSGRTSPGKRLWRGNSSGAWNYCGRWIKGQKSRSWGNVPAWFEGWQTPLHMRLPKLRWFKRYFKLLKYYEPINTWTLEQDERIEDGATLDKTTLVSLGYLRKVTSLTKILGTWKLHKRLIFEWIDAVSASALSKIESAWWSVVLIDESIASE